MKILQTPLPQEWNSKILVVIIGSKNHLILLLDFKYNICFVVIGITFDFKGKQLVYKLSPHR